jgi:4-hydroxybenzoate polyprenyltransferase
MVGVAFMLEHQTEDLADDRAAGVSTFMLGLTPKQRIRAVRGAYRFLHASAFGAVLALMAMTTPIRALTAAGMVIVATGIIRRILKRYYAANYERRATLVASLSMSGRPAGPTS